MKTDLSTVMTLLIYAMICVLSVMAYHFALIDSTLETVVLTGALGHLGLSYFPANSTVTPNTSTGVVVK